MKEVKIDLTPQAEQNSNHQSFKRKKSHWKKIIIASVIILIIVGLMAFSSALVFSDQNLIKNLSELNIFQQISRLIGSQDKMLKGEKEDRINFLLMGIGGKNHEGGTLADTILLASFKPSTNQAAIMSLPRDLRVWSENYGWVKINALNAYAEARKSGSGGKVMSQAIGKILETEIHYYGTVDFEGFEKLIDELGGVEVEVERDLIDYQYPIRGKEYVFPIENRFETLIIRQGWQQMDGALALKYARSRHAIGAEGSDFARSRRQQKILAAMKNKIFSLSTLFNPAKINSLLTAYNNHIFTNIEIWEMLKLIKLISDVEPSEIINFVLDDGPNGLLQPRIINGGYFLLPQDENFQEIKNIWHYIFYKELERPLFVKNESDQNDSIIRPEPVIVTEPKAETPPAPQPEKNFQDEKAMIEIRNGTFATGWAGRERDKLIKQGFNVRPATNASRRDYQTIFIYDFSQGQYPLTAQTLAEIYNTTINEPPDDLKATTEFVIILGQ